MTDAAMNRLGGIFLSGGARCCRICRCTDTRACPAGCWWIGPNLCSACEGKALEKGVLMSPPMVHAILREVEAAGTGKVMTRRLAWRFKDVVGEDGGEGLLQTPTEWQRLVVGDVLWVRETWAAVWPGADPAPLEQCQIQYRADLPDGSKDGPGGWPAADYRGNPDAPKWRSSQRMPRWCSRLLLTVTSLRLERLQDIPEEDTIREGGIRLPATGRVVTYRAAQHLGSANFDGRSWFRSLWEGLHGTDAWRANPEVVVVGFSPRRVEPVPPASPSSAETSSTPPNP